MFVENLTAFFADFGTPCTIGARQVSGIYKAPYAPGLGSLMEERTEPTLLCIADDVADIKHGTTVKVEGQSARFVIGGFEPEGTGLTRLILTRK